MAWISSGVEDGSSVSSVLLLGFLRIWRSSVGVLLFVLCVLRSQNVVGGVVFDDFVVMGMMGF